MLITDWITANRDMILRQRRFLHEHPELSMQEFATTEYIAQILQHNGLTPRVFPWGTGLYCDLLPITFNDSVAQNITEPLFAIRADIDALPMQEDTRLPFSSVNPGVSHSCGHDIHTAILLGLAQFLAQPAVRRYLLYPVRLIFQPAEEVMPGGALRAEHSSSGSTHAWVYCR